MNNWGANHGAISFGHIGADLITLASLLRIPVAMHNVPDTQVFRPSAWGLFGAQDPTWRRLPRLRQLRPALRLKSFAGGRLSRDGSVSGMDKRRASCDAGVHVRFTGGT